jgi:hypothetical protein
MHKGFTGRLIIHHNMKPRPTTPLLLLFATVATAYCATFAYAFSSHKNRVRLYNNIASPAGRSQLPLHRTHDGKSTKLNNLFKDDEEDDLEKYDFKTAAQIRKARQLLKESKKKIEEKQQQLNGAKESESNIATETISPLPFFATQTKIKSKTSSGIIADGETMSQLSKSEPWEYRPLSQMFDREPRADYDGNIVQGENSGGATLADKDLARNILALKKMLQNEDFKRVFDQRNRFIGDIE